MAKLSDRSAIRKKSGVFLPDQLGLGLEVKGKGDQEPPGDTWRHPMGSNFFYLY